MGAGGNDTAKAKGLIEWQIQSGTSDHEAHALRVSVSVTGVRAESFQEARR
jgi:hypothetical protein